MRLQANWRGAARRLAVVLTTAVVVSGCLDDVGHLEPSAVTGTVGTPPSRFAWALANNSITFSPDGFDVVQVVVSGTTDHVGHPRMLFIDVRQSRSLHQQGGAVDETEVAADTDTIEIDWSTGEKQMVPLAFPGQRGLMFPIRPLPKEADTALGPHHMEIVLKVGGGDFDVRIPAMRFSGHRLEFPVIHFRRVS